MPRNPYEDTSVQTVNSALTNYTDYLVGKEIQSIEKNSGGVLPAIISKGIQTIGQTLIKARQNSKIEALNNASLEDIATLKNTEDYKDTSLEAVVGKKVQTLLSNKQYGALKTGLNSISNIGDKNFKTFDKLAKKDMGYRVHLIKDAIAEEGGKNLTSIDAQEVAQQVYTEGIGSLIKYGADIRKNSNVSNEFKEQFALQVATAKRINDTTVIKNSNQLGQTILSTIYSANENKALTREELKGKISSIKIYDEDRKEQFLDIISIKNAELKFEEVEKKPLADTFSGTQLKQINSGQLFALPKGSHNTKHFLRENKKNLILFDSVLAKVNEVSSKGFKPGQKSKYTPEMKDKIVALKVKYLKSDSINERVNFNLRDEINSILNSEGVGSAGKKALNKN